MYAQSLPFTCGPAVYMEEFCIFKNRRKELKLHERGRIKPSRMFLGVSFLEVNPKLHLYIEDTRLAKGVIGLTYNKDIPNFESEITEYYNKLIEKHSAHIHIVDASPEGIISFINNSLEKRKKIFLLSHSSYWLEKGWPHWITIKGIDDDSKYLAGDPRSGKVKLFSKEDIINQLHIIKKYNFHIQIVTD